jgi:PIN domain
MHIILDANIYAADYKFSGVSFRTLFDYIRITESRLVLPRIIREEVVCGFGRRLKKESKDFLEAHRRYKLVDIDKNVPEFRKPNINNAMRRLRRKLMKPSDNVIPLYAAETAGVSIDDVFLRGVHRLRPSNDEGEELRDVIIWLWVLSYSGTAPENVAFLSQDSAFWSNDEPHPRIAHDILGSQGRLSIHRTIDEFLKRHAPAPTEITSEWFSQHFNLAQFERDSVNAATQELVKALQGSVRDVQLEELNFNSGSLYEVAAGVQFTEMKLSLVLNLTNIVAEHEQRGFAWEAA